MAHHHGEAKGRADEEVPYPDAQWISTRIVTHIGGESSASGSSGTFFECFQLAEFNK